MVIEKMNTKQLYRIATLIAIVVISFLSCLPNGEETIVIPSVPKEFHNGWQMRIRCVGTTSDIIILNFRITDFKKFEASTESRDYESDTINIYAQFKGSYDQANDVLVCKITSRQEPNSNNYREDSLQFKLSDYDGQYVTPTTKLYGEINSSCKSEVRFIFNSKSGKSALIEPPLCNCSFFKKIDKAK